MFPLRYSQAGRTTVPHRRERLCTNPVSPVEYIVGVPGEPKQPPVLRQQPTDEPSAPPEVHWPNRNTEPLPDSFHRARRNYAVVSALLLAWQLLRIHPLETVVTPPANGADTVEPGPHKGVVVDLFKSVKIEIDVPEAAPYVLVAFLAYFAYRFVTEWLHLPAAWRIRRSIRAELIVAHSMAAAALTVYVIQLWTKLRLGERALEISAGLVAGVVGVLLAFDFLPAARSALRSLDTTPRELIESLVLRRALRDDGSVNHWAWAEAVWLGATFTVPVLLMTVTLIEEMYVSGGLWFLGGALTGATSLGLTRWMSGWRFHEELRDGIISSVRKGRERRALAEAGPESAH